MVVERGLFFVLFHFSRFRLLYLTKYPRKAFQIHSERCRCGRSTKQTCQISLTYVLRSSCDNDLKIANFPDFCFKYSKNQYISRWTAQGKFALRVASWVPVSGGKFNVAFMGNVNNDRVSGAEIFPPLANKQN